MSESGVDMLLRGRLMNGEGKMDGLEGVVVKDGGQGMRGKTAVGLGYRERVVIGRRGCVMEIVVGGRGRMEG